VSVTLRGCKGKKRKKISKAQTAGANCDFKKSLRETVHRLSISRVTPQTQYGSCGRARLQSLWISMKL